MRSQRSRIVAMLLSVAGSASGALAEPMPGFGSAPAEMRPLREPDEGERKLAGFTPAGLPGVEPAAVDRPAGEPAAGLERKPAAT